MINATVHSCSRCSMSQICLPLGINKNEVAQLENLVETSKTKTPGEIIFRQGDPFQKVYAVKSGSLKSSRVDSSGNEHVLGFHLPGELVGLDGIYPEHYSCETQALDTSVLCEMDYQKLTQLCTDIPALQRQLLRLLSRDIYESQVTNASVADQTAMQKVAGFLHNLSIRYELRGYSSTRFQLAMSRQDIANHLGITPETVSRILKNFKQEKIIELEGRQLNLLSLKKLDSIILCAHTQT